MYAYHVLSLSLHGFVYTFFFWPFFEPDTKTEIGMVMYMYLKHSPDYIDSQYIWVHGTNSLSSSISAEMPFLAFLALHRGRKRYGQVGPSTCYSQSEVIYAYLVLDLLLQEFF